MNAIKCFWLTVYLLIRLLSVSMGQSIILRQTNETGVYKRRGEVRVTLLLKDKNTDSILIEIRKDFSKQLAHRMVNYEGDSLLVFSETFFEPTTYILQASTKNESGIIGFIVAPEEFKLGTNRPKDFDELCDGERILVIGESEGGGQALEAAGLDHRVGTVVATVSAMCDWSGDWVGHKGNWPYPLSTKNDKEKLLSTVPYFDVAHILKGSKATIVVEIGLIDQTCPSSALYAALNQAVEKNSIYSTLSCPSYVATCL